MPQHHHRMGAMLGEQRLRKAMETLKASIAQGVTGMPRHKEFLRQYCPAPQS
jgi:tryptophan halogenase